MASSTVTVAPLANFPRMEVTASADLKPYRPDTSKLTVVQHLALTTASTAFSCWFTRPVVNLQHFFFMTQAPQLLPQPKKVIRFNEVRRQLGWSGWWKSTTPYHMEVLGFTGLFGVYTVTNSSVSATPNVWWPMQGFVSGALTGLVLAAVKHPYDALRTTAQMPGPKEFTGPMDVLLTAVKNKPEVLKGLYKGYGISAAAHVCQWSLFFGMYELGKHYFGRDGAQWFFPFAWFCAAFSDTMQYPFKYVKSEIVRFNRHRRFGHVGYRQYLKEIRRSEGLTFLWTGYYKTKPIISSITLATTLFLYEQGQQFLATR